MKMKKVDFFTHIPPLASHAAQKQFCTTENVRKLHSPMVVSEA
jgi:hypothetical protein